MKAKLLLSVFLMVVFSKSVFSQSEKFFDALNFATSNPEESMSLFLETYNEDKPFHGTCHFLGVLYAEKGKMDSAIYFFEKSIELNVKNSNNTKEMTYTRIVQTYSRMLMFEKALTRGWEGLNDVSDNQMIEGAIEDACLWSYYINQQELNPDYLKSTDIKEEYVVRSIPQEYLILRTIRVNGEFLHFTGQSLVFEKKQAYDILSAETSKTEKKYDVKFRIDWDMNKEFGGRNMNTEEVSQDYSLPASQIIGAMLVENKKIDLVETIKTVLKKKTGN